MRRARPFVLPILVATLVLGPSGLAQSITEPPNLPNPKIVTRKAWVSSHFNFKLRVACLPADARLPCARDARVLTVKPVFFGSPLVLTEPVDRRYYVKPGTERAITFHIRNGQTLLERQRRLWVKAEFTVDLGKDADQAVLLRMKPPKR